jgi:hypothetical protein
VQLRVARCAHHDTTPNVITICCVDGTPLLLLPTMQLTDSRPRSKHGQKPWPFAACSEEIGYFTRRILANCYKLKCCPVRSSGSSRLAPSISIKQTSRARVGDGAASPADVRLMGTFMASVLSPTQDCAGYGSFSAQTGSVLSHDLPRSKSVRRRSHPATPAGECHPGTHSGLSPSYCFSVSFESYRPARVGSPVVLKTIRSGRDSTYRPRSRPLLLFVSHGLRLCE